MKDAKRQESINKFEAYILNCINSENYEVEAVTPLDKLNFVLDTFKREYGHEIKRLGEQKAFEEWLRGLPSAIDIDFYNYEILKRCREFGVLEAGASEKREQSFLDQWWSRIYMAVIRAHRKYSANPKPVRKTRDEYQVLGNYGQGFEVVTSEDSYSAVRERLKEYRENERGVEFIYKKVRVKI